MERLIQDMESCYQTSGINMLQHGEMVREEYQKLLLCLPEYILDLRDLVLSSEITDRYQVFHDCGKPYCVSDGEARFPNHAETSASTWLSLHPEDKIVADLMRHDMDFHLGTHDWTSPLAPTLYLTAWAELFANANMFGGVESTSFKIKRKRLIKAGKDYVRHLSSGERSIQGGFCPMDV